MIPRLWMPFGVYYAFVLATAPSLRAWNRLLGSVFLQCLTCFYTGWFLAMGLAVFLPALVATRAGAAADLWRLAWGRRGAAAGVALGWGLAMVALFAPYLVYNASAGHPYEGCHGCLPTTAAWLTGPPAARWEQALAEYSQPKYGECRLFCGFGVYALMLAAALSAPFLDRRRQPALWSLTAAGLLTAAVWWVLTISTAPDGDSLWRWVRYLPGGPAVRVVSRVYVVVYLFGTLAALAWLHMVAERVPNRGLRGGLLGAAAAVLVWEQTGIEKPSFARADFYPLVDRVAADMRGAEVGYVLPRYTDRQGVVWDGPYGEVFAMWVGMRANVPVVNGYSGVLPPGYLPFALLTDDQLRACVRPKVGGRVRVRVLDPDFPDRAHEVVVD
jgi:hypothetical protein